MAFKIEVLNYMHTPDLNPGTLRISDKNIIDEEIAK
jgi:hypothetical protein